MRKRSVWLGLLLCAGGSAVLLAIGGLRGESDRGESEPARRPERSVAPGGGAAARPWDVAAAPPPAGVDPAVLRLARGPRPGSLADTDVDGGLSVDADGHFRPDPDALALFDYFLSATGEEPDAVIRQRILDEVHARLEVPAAGEAVAFLDDYLAYREELQVLAVGDDIPHDLERRMQWLRELRRSHFGEDSEGLFGVEEATVRVDLERRRVWTDPSLDEGERAQRLAALDDELPDSVREARRRASAPARLRGEVRRLRAEGAEPGEVFALREDVFGSEAAERLAALDHERATWDARVDAYRAERSELLAELGHRPEDPASERSLPEADRARLEALRSAHFEAPEILRVRVLDGAI